MSFGKILGNIPDKEELTTKYIKLKYQRTMYAHPEIEPIKTDTEFIEILRQL